MRHTRQWFINRIGKRIYRKSLSCGCESCQKNHVDIGKSGRDGTQHADYIYLCQDEMGIEYDDNIYKVNK